SVAGASPPPAVVGVHAGHNERPRPTPAGGPLARLIGRGPSRRGRSGLGRWCGRRSSAPGRLRRAQPPPHCRGCPCRSWRSSRPGPAALPAATARSTAPPDGRTHSWAARVGARYRAAEPQVLPVALVFRCSPVSTCAAAPATSSPRPWRAPTPTAGRARSTPSGRSSPTSASGVTTPCATSQPASTASSWRTCGSPGAICPTPWPTCPPASGRRWSSPATRSWPTTAPRWRRRPATSGRGSSSATWSGRSTGPGATGRAVYPSTVLMTAIPAQVAGVPEIALCVPPGPDGNVPQATLAAAALLAIDEVYRIGGAQAIAAMAYGTESIRPVDVIVGPGNVYVTLAKREVAGVVGIESTAGPSELVVVADESAPPDYVAIDLMAQAEHGPNGAALRVTWSEALADDVAQAIDRLLAESSRRADSEADP